jgi:hypothetical protein
LSPSASLADTVTPALAPATTLDGLTTATSGQGETTEEPPQRRLEVRGSTDQYSRRRGGEAPRRIHEAGRPRRERMHSGRTRTTDRGAWAGRLAGGALAVAAAWLLAGCGESVPTAAPTSFAQAQTLAAKLKRPILLDFGTQW